MDKSVKTYKQKLTEIYYVIQLDCNNIGYTKTYKNTHNH